MDDDALTTGDYVEYLYDEWNRLATETRHIDQSTYAVSYQYDTDRSLVGGNLVVYTVYSHSAWVGYQYGVGLDMKELGYNLPSLPLPPYPGIPNIPWP